PSAQGAAGIALLTTSTSFTPTSSGLEEQPGGGGRAPGVPGRCGVVVAPPAAPGPRRGGPAPPGAPRGVPLGQAVTRGGRPRAGRRGGRWGAAPPRRGGRRGGP